MSKRKGQQSLRSLVSMYIAIEKDQGLSICDRAFKSEVDSCSVVADEREEEKI